MEIRKPAVAGMFYPGNAVELTKSIALLYSEVDKVALSGRPMAIIAPHAGYPYSGRIAAKAYKLLEGEEYDNVVIVSPSHTVFFQGASVYGGDGYQTPLGVVEINQDLSHKMANIHPSVYLSNMGHATGGSRGEHSLEVHLPFLQIVLGTKFKLVAIVMGDQEPESVSAVAEVLASTLKGTNTLLVASTDLSHFHPEKVARKLDYAVQAAIEKYDSDLLRETLESGQGEACGGGPVAAVMQATKRLGGSEVRFLDYNTSGATTGQFDEVVGYLSAAIIGGSKVRIAPKAEIGAHPAKPTGDDFTDDDKQLLKKIANDAIVHQLENRRYTPPVRDQLEIRRGVFVTIYVGDELNGCMGQVRGRDPLNQSVAELAVAAAFEDPRFEPLTMADLPAMKIEISLLSRLERVKDFRDIVVGRDGLMIRLDMHSGLLLPKVATEHKWNATTFLEQVCLKAGLPKNAYKDKLAEIYKFSADVF